jgi:putative glutamine amidotransferase
MEMYKRKIIIGITLDVPQDQSYSVYPWYAIRKNYADAVSSVGATPLFLPCNLSSLQDYVDIIDGAIVSGGDFDIDPKLYGENIKSNTVTTNEIRTDFEMALMKKMIELNKPMIGICGGMQLLNVIAGGTLVQDIKEEYNSQLHQQQLPKHIPSHSITIAPGSLLNKITNSDGYMVNSSHHQAVKKLGIDIKVSAIAPDGIVEAIENTKQKFCIGVQWHPEYCYSDQDNKIFYALVQSCVV